MIRDSRKRPPVTSRCAVTLRQPYGYAAVPASPSTSTRLVRGNCSEYAPGELHVNRVRVDVRCLSQKLDRIEIVASVAGSVDFLT